jgi:hypothetical protein
MNRIAISVILLCALTGCGPTAQPIVIEKLETEYGPVGPESAWHELSDVEMPEWGKNALRSTLQDDEDIIGVNLFEPNTFKVRTRFKDKRKRGSGRIYEFIGKGTNWIERSQGNWIS